MWLITYMVEGVNGVKVNRTTETIYTDKHPTKWDEDKRKEYKNLGYELNIVFAIEKPEDTESESEIYSEYYNNGQ